jgi:hypothetical protein
MLLIYFRVYWPNLRAISFDKPKSHNGLWVGDGITFESCYHDLLQSVTATHPFILSLHTALKHDFL